MSDKVLMPVLGELQDGEDWDDQLTLTMRRDQWHATLAILTAQGLEMRELYESAVAAASKGDWGAMVVAPQLSSSVDMLGSILTEVAELTVPHLAHEAQKEARAARSHEKQCPHDGCDFVTYHSGKLRIHLRTEHPGNGN